MYPPLDINLVIDYKSASQKARVVSELWVEQNIPCPLCQGKLNQCVTGTVGFDFFCEVCDEEYQLKAIRRQIPKKLTGAEYNKTKEMFEEGSQPHLLLLVYDPASWIVLNLFFIHRKHLTPSILLPRKKLEPPARRAGWQGCHWDLKEIPRSKWMTIV